MLNDLKYLKSTYGDLSSWDHQAADNCIFFDLYFGDAKFNIAIHYDDRGVADDTSIVPNGVYNTYGRNRWGSVSAMCDHFANSYDFFKHVKHGSTDFLEMNPGKIAREMKNFTGCPAMCCVNLFITVCNNIFNRKESIYKDGDGESSPSSSSSGRLSSSSSRSSSSKGDIELYRARRKHGVVCLIISGALFVLSVILLIIGDITAFQMIWLAVVAEVALWAALILLIVGLVKVIRNAIRVARAKR